MTVLDPDSNEIFQEGQIGELCIAGPQVAIGYLNRDDLTRAFFIDHPQFQGSLYRTGDLARISDGQVHFVGRKQGDTQVKIHGQRIELGEIEHAIQRHHTVIDCAVIHCDEQVYAFVVSHVDMQTGEPVTHATYALPLNIRPIYLALEQIPVSASGKRDTRALIALAHQHAAREADTPQNEETRTMSPKEQVILEVAQNVLSHTIDRTREFSDFGLDSLGAIKFVMQLRDRSLEATVYNVLSAGNVASLARRTTESPAALVQGKSDETHAATVDVTDLREQYGQDCYFYPASQLQASMIGASLADSAGQLYYNNIHLRLQSGISPHMFLEHWQTLIEHHEILRTAFLIDSTCAKSDFLQIVHSSRKEFTHFKTVVSNDVMKTIAAHKQETKLDRQNLLEPAVDVQYIALEVKNSASTEIHLSIMLHHALYDAWSLELILSDLSSLMRSGTIPDRPQYRHTLQSMDQLADCGVDSKEYWFNYMSKMNTINFPNLSQRSSNSNHKNRTTRKLNMSLERLDQNCLVSKINPQILGQLAWSLFLSWISGESSVASSLTTSGRSMNVPGLDVTSGPFITTFPFAFEYNPDATIEETYDVIREYNMLLTKHNMAYRDILRSVEQRSYPDTLFIYQKSNPDIEHDSSVTVLDQEDRLEFRVMLTFDRQSDGLFMCLAADSGLVSNGAAEKILCQIEHIVLQALSDSSQPLKSLSRLPKPLQSIANENTDQATAGRLDDLYYDMDMHRAKSPALHFFDNLEEARIVTYGDLNEEANKLANALAALLTEPEEVIAICLDKSIAMYAAILAVLKLGCAYVALEPSLPDDRLQVILQVTGVRYVYTNGDKLARFGAIHVILVEDCLQSSSATEFVSRPSKGLAYILMTSGTTGVPKACAVTHSNVLSNCQALSQLYPHDTQDRMMQFTSCKISLPSSESLTD